MHTRVLALVLVTACSSGSSSTPRTTTPPPAAPAPAPPLDACAADAARIQPALEANAALYEKWGFAPEDVDKLALPPAATELTRIPPNLPVIVMTPRTIEMFRQARTPSEVRATLRSMGAREYVLAIEAATPWPAVVRLVHELPSATRAHIAFAVDASAARVSDPAAVQKLRESGSAAFQELGRDMATRCRAIGEMFLTPTEQLLPAISRDAGPALRGCKCSVTATELANVNEALLVRGYIAGRSVIVGGSKVTVGDGRSATFATAARKLAALPTDAEVAVAVDR